MKPVMLILAAGMGSRYGGLKQIDPVGENGEAIIDFSVYDAMRSGFGRLVFVIRKDIEEEFRTSIGMRFEKRIDVDYVFQRLEDVPAGQTFPADRQKPWGTGHAVYAARDAVKSPFAVINGDDFYGHDSFRRLSSHLEKETGTGNDYAMISYTLKNTLSPHGHVSRGICALDREGFLKSIVEHTKIETDDGRIFAHDDRGSRKELTGDETVSMNMFGFTPGIFGFLDRDFRKFMGKKSGDPKAEFYIPTVVSGLINSREARVRVINTASEWFGITYKEDRGYVMESIRELIRKKVYPAQLWEDA